MVEVGKETSPGLQGSEMKKRQGQCLKWREKRWLIRKKFNLTWTFTWKSEEWGETNDGTIAEEKNQAKDVELFKNSGFIGENARGIASNPYREGQVGIQFNRESKVDIEKKEQII